MPESRRISPDDYFDPRPGDKKEEPDELVGDDFRYAQELYNRGMDVTYPRETVQEALEADEEDALDNMHEKAEYDEKTKTENIDLLYYLGLKEEYIDKFIRTIDQNVLLSEQLISGIEEHNQENMPLKRRQMLRDWLTGVRDTVLSTELCNQLKLYIQTVALSQE